MAGSSAGIELIDLTDAVEVSREREGRFECLLTTRALPVARAGNAMPQEAVARCQRASAD
jgi:hypothetical protein